MDRNRLLAVLAAAALLIISCVSTVTAAPIVIKDKDRGIGTEALILGLEIARTQYHIDYIFGDTAGRNNRMKRVFEKTGFELIETVPNAFELPDGRYDSRLIWKKRLKDDGDDA